MNHKVTIASILVIALVFGYLFIVNPERKTLDGGANIVKKIKYINSSKDLIDVTLPTPGAVVGKSFSVTGQARGTWYFEASFPVLVLGKDGEVLDQIPAAAESDWMTENFVPFRADIEIPDGYTGPATVVLKNDNPSGDPARDKSISFDINIEY